MIYSLIGQWAEPVIWLCFTLSVCLGFFLARTISPIEKCLMNGIRLEAHQLRSLKLIPYLAVIEKRYLELIQSIDDVDAHDFCMSERHSLMVAIGPICLSAEKMQDFICQAPAILISLGLLGTFAGLTGGLGEIQMVLLPELTAQQAASSLANVISPMSLAFRTSLMGLILSLALSIIHQISGWKNLLDRYESILVSWLETVVPVRLGESLSTPLRRSIEELNATSRQLPSLMSEGINSAMESVFAKKIDQFFEVYIALASEAERSVKSLSYLTGAIKEGGMNFLTASEVIGRSSFAKDLQSAVTDLDGIKSDLIHAATSLCERMATFREAIGATNSDWQVLTKLSAEELKKSNSLATLMTVQQESLKEVVLSSQTSVDELSTAAKELRSTRLEVGRERKMMQNVAEAIQSRLGAGEDLSKSYLFLSDSLSELLAAWKDSASSMRGLYVGLVKKSEDDMRELVDWHRNEHSAWREMVAEAIKSFQATLNKFDEHTIRLESLIEKNEKAISSFGKDKNGNPLVSESDE